MRHAESLHNKKGLVAGRIESPLTELGITQAHTTAIHLKDAAIQAVFTSSLSRAHHTATIIAEEHGITPIIDDQFTEIDAGVLEGKNIAQLQDHNPSLFEDFKCYSWERVPKAERIAQLIVRASSAWTHIVDYIMTQHVNQVLLVSHGGFLQWLFKSSLGAEGNHVQQWAPIITFSNCGISTLVIEPYVKNKVTHSHFAFWKRINYIAYENNHRPHHKDKTSRDKTT